MADEYVILSRMIARGDPELSVFVRLTCEEVNEISMSVPRKLVIHEGFGLLSPIVVLTIADARGDMFNHMMPDTGAKFNLAIGRDVDDAITFPMKIAKYEQANSALGRPHDMEMKITFVMEGWFNTFTKKHSRSWKDKLVTEVVEEIAGECGFSSVEVTPSKDTLESIIQPWWSNSTMMKWLRKRGYPDTDTDGHYEYGMNLDGVFKFMSVNDIIEKKLPEIRSKSVPVLRLQAPKTDTSEYVADLNANKMIPAFFVSISNTNEYMSGISAGASGITPTWWDWETGEYKSEQLAFDGQRFPQLSDLSMIRDVDVEANIQFNGGRDTRTVEYARNELSEASNSMNSIVVMTQGTPYARSFEVMEIIIPNTDLGSKIPINEIHSGFYTVAGVQHIFALGEDTGYTTEMTMVRHGVDEVDFDGFEDLLISAEGKVV